MKALEEENAILKLILGQKELDIQALKVSGGEMTVLWNSVLNKTEKHAEEEKSY